MSFWVRFRNLRYFKKCYSKLLPTCNITVSAWTVRDP